MDELGLKLLYGTDSRLLFVFTCFVYFLCTSYTNYERVDLKEKENE